MARSEFTCEVCQRPIGARRAHWIIRGAHVMHAACLDTRRAHKIGWPDCSVPWHDDAFDHGDKISATLAGARWALREAAREL